MSEFKKYEDYLKSKLPEVSESLEKAIKTPKSGMKFGPNGVYSELSDSLSLYLSPDPNERRDQIIELGYDPDRIGFLDLSGAPKFVAHRVVENLSGEYEDHIHSFAGNLLESLKKILK